jgi:chromosome segregation ATPase
MRSIVELPSQRLRKLQREMEELEAELTQALEAVEVAKAALREIAAEIDCGCVPCRGQCRSESALAIELEGRQDVATAALARLEGSNG